MERLKGSDAYILVAPDEVPTIVQLLEAVTRLTKDAAVIGRCRGHKDEDPASLALVASFLETFVQKYKKQLRK